MLADGEEFRIHHGDCISHMTTEMQVSSVDLVVTSPPFPVLYAYNSSSADVGNSEDGAEMKIHLGFFYRGLARVLKPGRCAIIHVMQIPRLKRVGGRGLVDFRGLNIRLAERAGLHFTYDWHIRKNPQAQAVRTHSHELQFAGLEKDRARSRGALGDYLIKLEAPGTNSVPVESKGDVSRDDWIKLAEGSWSDIVETDTLNVARAKGAGDTKHVCPLQLGIYQRCIRLFTNPGEVVFDPFAGVGSGGFSALGGKSPKTGDRVTQPRRFYGCELKDSYHAAAVANCEKAIDERAWLEKCEVRFGSQGVVKKQKLFDA